MAGLALSGDKAVVGGHYERVRGSNRRQQNRNDNGAYGRGGERAREGNAREASTSARLAVAHVIGVGRGNGPRAQGERRVRGGKQTFPWNLIAEGLDLELNLGFKMSTER